MSLAELDNFKQLDLKERRMIELQDFLNKRIEIPFGSLFEIGMGVNLNGDVFVSALEFSNDDIEKIPNHSKGNCRVFQALSKEENLKQIEIVSKIQVCGLCLESAGLLNFMQS